MTDVNQLITEHLDIWTSAIEKKSVAGRGDGGAVSLYGIKKLRELIIELAVHGKLVPQDPAEGSANDLLKAVEQKQRDLVKQNKIKNQKSKSPAGEEDTPFALPTGWTWTRLSELAVISPRNEVDDDLVVSFVPMPDVHTSHTGEHDHSERRWGDVKKSYTHFADGDIALAKITPCFENSKAAVFSNLYNGVGAGTTELHVARLHSKEIIGKFILLHLKAPSYLQNGKAVMTGSAGQKRVPRWYFADTPIALPPTAEQHRIVAKVDELMGLCDALEAQTEGSLKAHQALVETCLATLTNSQTPEDLAQNWTRIEAHFDTLFTTEEGMAEMYKIVLQLAMMGLLEDQDSSESSASLLVAASKKRADLVARKEVKAFKAQAIHEGVEKPFKLPIGWSWLRLGDATSLITKGSSPKWQGVSYTHDPNEVMFVTSENVGRFEMLLENPKYVEKKFNTLQPRSILKAGDFLMNIVGASIGRTAIYPGPEGANINQAVCLIRVLPGLFDQRFLIAFFNSEFCRNYMFDKQVDNARANLSMGNISQFLIPVPPIDEQRAIAEKIEILLGLGSDLTNKIQVSAFISTSLADTLTSKIH